MKKARRENMTQKQGVKHDHGKARFDLIPPEPLWALADLYTKGAEKYEDRNWEKGMRWGRVFAALMRHAWKWWSGEEYDPEDGQHHLISVAWCAFALYTYFIRKIGEDDRPKDTALKACINTLKTKKEESNEKQTRLG